MEIKRGVQMGARSSGEKTIRGITTPQAMRFTTDQVVTPNQLCPPA
jgi:hypothetical protein